MYNVSDMKERSITIKKAAEILGVNRETLRRWDIKGRFKAKRHPINRYRMYDLVSVRALQAKIQKGGTL
jgi:DNA-binding transcriptional MerR regulator